MKQAGCVRVNFGIESGNDSTLKRLQKNFTVADVRRAISLATKAGIEVDGMFMLGLPGESPEEALNTIALARSSNIRFAIFNLFVPYPGCQLYDDLTGQGKITYQAWTDFSSYWTVGGGLPVYIPQGWTPESLKQIQAKAMKNFYMSPRFIIRQIKDFKPSMLGAYWRGLKGVLGMGGSAQ